MSFDQYMHYRFIEFLISASIALVVGSIFYIKYFRK